LGLFFALCSLAAGHGWAEDIRLAAVDLNRYTHSPDSLVARAMQEVRASRPDSALANVDRLIAMRPDFKLAYLIKGDVLLSKGRPLTTFGAAPAASKESLGDLKEEARVRLLRYLDEPPPDSLPKQILQLAPSQKYALLADASRARLYVFENAGGEPRLVRDFYLSVGRNGVDKRSEGDKKTPVGVYSISAELPRKQLTAFYGAGAFPLNYPNEWDLIQGRSGHGIWLHGVPPDTYSRPPKASDGCLVVTNPDYTELARFLRGGNTPIVITDRAEWLPRAAWSAHRQGLLDKLDAWKNDWQNLDVERFLSHYAASFLTREGKGWTEAKRRNIAQKSWIRIGLTDLSLFQPDDDLVLGNFTQAYDSDKLRDITNKRVYLRKEAGNWRIALEKSLHSAPALAANND
jgi:murein L,D-transpeptidase YafK